MGADEAELLTRAVGGEHHALELLLVRYQGRLMARVRRKLPPSLVGLISPEDVLQEAYVDVFRGITAFQPSGAAAFYRWLLTVTDNRMIDMIRAMQAAKRGGGRLVEAPQASGVIPLFELVEVTSHTPSRSVAGQEVAAAVMAAMNGLKPQYRDALRLRFLEGMAVSETAERLGCTEYAVHKLCSRGLARLRESLGSSERLLSRR